MHKLCPKHTHRIGPVASNRYTGGGHVGVRDPQNVVDLSSIHQGGLLECSEVQYRVL